MGQLLVDRKIEHGVWYITFSLVKDSVSEFDKQQADKFNEPMIDTGGDFGDDPNEYSLPSNLIRIFTGLPFVQQFDSKSPDFETNTEVKALAFEAEFKDRYEDAITTLRAEEDTFTGKQLFTF